MLPFIVKTITAPMAFITLNSNKVTSKVLGFKILLYICDSIQAMTMIVNAKTILKFSLAELYLNFKSNKRTESQATKARRMFESITRYNILI